MIPFLSRLFTKKPQRPKTTSPNFSLGEGLEFTKTLDVPYRIAYIRNKSVPAKMIFAEIVVREPSGKETTGDLKSHKYKPTGHELYVNPHGPLLWSDDAQTLYFSRTNVEVFDAVSGEIRDIPLSVPDGCWFRLLGRTRDGRLLVSQRGVAQRGKKSGPLLVPNSEKISIINPTTSATEMVAQEDESQFFWKYTYDQSVNRFLFCLNYRDTTPNIVVVLDTTNGRRQQILQPDRGIFDFTMAPDGTSLVACNQVGLHRIQLGSETWENLLPYGGHPVWSPDGSQIAFMDGGSCLCVMPADGRAEDVRVLAYFEGHYNPKTTEDIDYSQMPIWSPDGRFLWFSLTLPARKQTLCTFIGDLLSHLGTTMVYEDGTEYRSSLWDSIRQAWKYGGSYHHQRVGVIDLEKNTVWMGGEDWKALSWCPVKE